MESLQALHTLCAASYLAIAAYVLWRAPRLNRSAGVAGLATCFAWWSASLVLAHDSGATRHQAITAYNIGVVAWASFGSLAVAFAYAFTGRSAALSTLRVRVALLAPPIVVIALQWSGSLASDYHLRSWGWAFDWSNSVSSWFFYLYYATYVTAAIVIVFLSMRRSKERLVRRQAAIIISTALVSFVCATATDVALPRLGIESIPNVAPAFLLLWTVGIAIAIVRYRLLELTPETAVVDILAAMHDGVLLMDRDEQLIAQNRAANEMLGSTADLRRVVLEGIRDERAAAAGVEIETSEARTLVVSSRPVSDANGQPLGRIALIRDVTEQRRAERERQVASAELEVRVIERTGALDAANRDLQRAVRRLGALQAIVATIHRADSTSRLGAALPQAVIAGFEIVGGCRVVLDEVASVSEPFDEVAAPLRFEIVANEAARGVLELHAAIPAGEHEVFERVASEIGQALEALAIRNATAQADRLASLGVLAAGVAHEINNPLSYLTLGLQEILDAANGPGPVDRSAVGERAEEALNGCARIAKVVSELGSFSRDSGEVGPIGVAKAVDTAITMARQHIRHRARLVTSQTTTATVRADAGQLTQVFLSLLLNAARSIPDGDVESHRIEVTSRDEADEVVVVVSDTGRGIAAPDLPRIFDPFFHAKPSDRGSGLALSISHKIVRALGGRIVVTSTVGEGTSFEVRLPRLSEGAARADVVRQPGDGRSARLLIVDDDALVAQSLGRMLRPHVVTIAASATEAKQLFERGESFDVVLCDLMMPGMHGPALFAWVAEHRPETAARMLFMSGGAFTPEIAAFAEEHQEHLLTKPFNTDAVRRAVRRLLSPDGEGA